MKRPSGVDLGLFRSFKSLQHVEVRPLTLFFGENNVGKSTLLRAIALLADSALGDAGESLAYDHSASARDSVFRGLCWAQGPECTLGLEWDGGFRASWTFRHETYVIDAQTSSQRVFVSKFDLDTGTEKLALTHEATDNDATSVSLRYRDRDDRPGVLTSEGLCFGRVDGPWAPLLDLLAQRLRPFARRVQWLQATRHGGLPRSLPIPTRPVSTMDPDGRNVGAILRTMPAVREAVAGRLREWIGRELETPDSGRHEFRVTLRPREGAAQTDLADHGEGIIQMLPVLTAVELLRHRHAEPDGPLVVAVEEPESHLHPAMQSKLASAICHAVANARDAAVVLETHSLGFLHGVRLAVATGALSPDDVSLYWVQQDGEGRSVADRVPITSAGDLGSRWPSEAFMSDLDLERSIIEAQRRGQA